MDMKWLVSILLILCLGIVSAEVIVKEVVDTTKSPAVFTVSTEQGIVVTPRIAVGKTNFFANGEKIHTESSISANERIVLPLKGVGNYELEIRTVLDSEYTWTRFKISSNDDPLYLDYVNYVKDKNRLTFAIKGADMIHPNDLERVGVSLNEQLESYSAIVNDKHKVYCYPRVRTGQPLGFTCSTYAYPNTIDIQVTVGIMETYDVELTTLPEIEEETQQGITTSQNENVIEEELVENEEIEIYDNINIEQVIPKQVNTTAITIITFLAIIALFVIFFVASHHKHESKQAGKHHPQKNDKQ